MIEQNLLVACNTQVKLEEEKNNLNLKKFVKSFKKMSKKGLIGDWVDADTLLRGLLHPSDYRKILHQIFVEPKVCSQCKYSPGNRIYGTTNIIGNNCKSEHT